MSRFVGAGKKLMSFLVPKPKVNTTKLGKATSELNKAIQKNKASRAKLKQTVFEMKNDMPITFKSNRGKSESNKEAYKRIQNDNTKVLKGMLDKATEKKADGGRIGLKGGSDDGSSLNKSINSLKRIMENKKKSKIPKNNFKRDRSPMERQRVLDKMKSEAQAMGGNVRTAGEMSPLKGESTKSFKERTDAKVGGRMGRKMGGGSDMSNTNVKKKFKNFSKLPETVQIKINKKLAKKV